MKRQKSLDDDEINEDYNFEPIQDDTFEEEDESGRFMAPKLQMSDLEGESKEKNDLRNGFDVTGRGGKLSLLKEGLNGLDLRKPISVEKKKTVNHDENTTADSSDII